MCGIGEVVRADVVKSSDQTRVVSEQGARFERSGLPIGQVDRPDLRWFQGDGDVDDDLVGDDVLDRFEGGFMGAVRNGHHDEVTVLACACVVRALHRCIEFLCKLCGLATTSFCISRPDEHVMAGLGPANRQASAFAARAANDTYLHLILMR